MKLIINEDIVKAKGMDTPSLLLCMLLKTGVDLVSLIEECLKRHIIYKDANNSIHVVSNYSDLVEDILMSGNKDLPKGNRIEKLADKMRELFPKQKKEGTASTYFRGNNYEITHRLKKFFIFFGNKYSDEQILEATKKYVDSFHGDYTYMRVLKYFIWKSEAKKMPDSDISVELISDLATMLENEGATTSASYTNSSIV